MIWPISLSTTCAFCTELSPNLVQKAHRVNGSMIGSSIVISINVIYTYVFISPTQLNTNHVEHFSLLVFLNPLIPLTHYNIY